MMRFVAQLVESVGVDKRWIPYETDGIEDTIELASIGCTLSLADVYDKVRLQDT